MPRLASYASAGFFVTPPRVVAAIRHLLAAANPGLAMAQQGGGRNRRQTVRLLDPCAGRGDAAAAIAAALGAESFGIELNDARAAACRQQLDHVLGTSAFSVRLANGAFNCVWLNPPYSDDDEHRRTEHAFLTALSRALAPGGLLIFLIPQRRLAVSARYLAAHYGGFVAYRFPDPEFGGYGQMVLFATKQRQPHLDCAAQETLEAWSAHSLAPLPDPPAEEA